MVLQNYKEAHLVSSNNGNPARLKPYNVTKKSNIAAVILGYSSDITKDGVQNNLFDFTEHIKVFHEIEHHMIGSKFFN